MQPRGVLAGELLTAEARAGDVLRAEADFEIDGISIVSVLAPKTKKRVEPERIELLAPAPTTGVTTQLVGRGDRGDRRPSEGRRTGREDGRGDRAARGRPSAGGAERGGRDSGARTTARRTGGEGGGVPSRGPSDRAASDRSSSSRAPSSSDRSSSRPDRAASSSGQPSGERRPRDGERRTGRPDRPAATPSESASRAAAGRRLNPGNTHRQEVLASLSPEQQPIAEQVLRGGIPAVRTAIHLEGEKAAAEGRPPPHADSLLAMAEELLPRLKAAEWRDRADAAVKVADNLALRDLRSVVAGGDLARDDETRQLAASLREMLETRLTAMREEWAREIAQQLVEGRVVRALRLASRAPEATTRLSAEQAQQLSDAASAAMSPDTAPDRWIALLEAVAASPVRRSVTPVGLPAEPGAALLNAAQQQVGRIPALSALLGISMPPPPGPARGAPGAPGARPPRQRPPRRPPAGAKPAGGPEESVEAVGGTANPTAPIFPDGGPDSDPVPPTSTDLPTEAPVATQDAPAGAPPGAPDAEALDRGAPDAGALDRGAPDAGALDRGAPDAGALDRGAPDAGAVDRGAPDAGAVDRGAPDAGAVDRGAPDAGAVDRGAPDGGAVDRGAPDAGAPDTEADGGHEGAMVSAESEAGDPGVASASGIEAGDQSDAPAGTEISSAADGDQAADPAASSPH